MKRINLKRMLRNAMMALSATLFFAACSENVDMSNRYTFTEYTILSYLEEDSAYTEYVKLLKKVPISDYSESTVAQLLSARGHITCFAPNNEAIQDYLDSLQRKGIITAPNWDGFPNEQVKDSIEKVIVYNSIIDGGNIQYYETANFPEEDGEEFDLPNMNDRKLSVYRGKVNPDSLYINGEYPIHMQHRDIEAINGRIHEVVVVIAPSADTLADKLREWISEGTTNYVTMARLILACGLEDTLSKRRDEVWEKMYQTGEIKDIPDLSSEGGATGTIPEHRYYGFTVFAETDAFWENTLGKSVNDITIDDLKNYLISTGLFPGASTDDNYTDENNIINLFTTYHILPERLTKDKLVIHYNELGYNYKTSKAYTVATEEFFTTMGKRRLIKFYESLESNGVYINRFPILRNGRGDYAPELLNINDYHESGKFCPIRGAATRDDENIGILVGESDSLNTVENVINAIVYPINNLLVYTENVAAQLMHQRIRFDVSTIFPEMSNNDHRGRRTAYTHGHARNKGFPTNYQYFENCEIKEGTRFYYLNGLAQNWYNWQGDEFNIAGRYEFTITLPPVPKEGHYELRLAVQSNSSVRSMCQVYWGDDKNYLPAAGIPFDMRLAGTGRHLSSGTIPDNTVGWEKDTGDPAVDDEVDKKMRNNGFMKGPNHYSATPGSSTPIRDSDLKLRRIMVSADM
nr:fasciclin domain-containing protein [Bacteroidaceae bacterium]